LKVSISIRAARNLGFEAFSSAYDAMTSNSR
jgi:hypothetical protein